MNFNDFIDKNRQQLVNDVNTIANSLTYIFDLNNSSSHSEKFYGKINGLCYVLAEITNNRIEFTLGGVDKFRIRFDKEKTDENVRKNLLPKLTTEVSSYRLGEYERPIVTIRFDKLTHDVVKDIMLLVNNCDAKLRPSRYERF